MTHVKHPPDTDESREAVTRESARIEAVARAIDPVAWNFIDAHENDVPPHPAVPLTRQRILGQASAALRAAAEFDRRNG